MFSILGYSRREIFQKFWPYVFCAFGTLCIILPMLLWKNFYIDWFRNTWLIEYYGEYIKAHGSFPQVINSYGTGKYQNYVGMMHPSYYGVWLYRILGILCALFGGGARRALFFSIFLLEIIQWVIWYKLLFVISGSKTNSAFVSTIYQLSIYGLTNLYCRNAVPEFYGSIFLSLSLGLWLLSLTEHNIKKRLFYWWNWTSFNSFIGNAPYISAFRRDIVTCSFPLYGKQFAKWVEMELVVCGKCYFISCNWKCIAMVIFCPAF